MPSFTITLEEVIEMEGEDNIGLSDYPIFDEGHRSVLNQKIIDHYYNQEIGQETISMFRLAMKRKMNEIMPAFNQQYALSQIKIDALSTVNMESSNTNSGNTTSTTEGDTTSTSDAKSRAVASQFPQNSLQADSEYATSAQDNISNSTASGESKETQAVDQTGTAVSTAKGYSGHQPELIFAARQTIVNIDLEIIYALETLFMGVWFTSTEFTTVRNRYDYPFGW
jgi:hypothetical protein